MVKTQKQVHRIFRSTFPSSLEPMILEIVACPVCFIVTTFNDLLNWILSLILMSSLLISTIGCMICYHSSVIRQKGESQNGCFKKTKHAKYSEKQTFFTPWYAHVRTGSGVLCFPETPILRFALLPYYRRRHVFDWHDHFLLVNKTTHLGYQQQNHVVIDEYNGNFNSS